MIAIITDKVVFNLFPFLFSKTFFETLSPISGFYTIFSSTVRASIKFTGNSCKGDTSQTHTKNSKYPNRKTFYTNNKYTWRVRQVSKVASY